jgi:hypothetical protein
MTARRLPRILVTIDDPCTVGRWRFPREREFLMMREARSYAARARRKGLAATMQLSPAPATRRTETAP